MLTTFFLRIFIVKKLDLSFCICLNGVVTKSYHNAAHNLVVQKIYSQQIWTPLLCHTYYQRIIKCQTKLNKKTNFYDFVYGAMVRASVIRDLNNPNSTSIFNLFIPKKQWEKKQTFIISFFFLHGANTEREMDARGMGCVWL